MRRRHSLTRLFVLGMLGAAAVTAVALWGYLAHERRREFRAEAARARQEFVDGKRREVVREVSAAVDFAEYTRERVAAQLRDTLRTRVEQAHAVATHLLERYRDAAPPGGLESLLRETLRPLRFDGGRGYLFAVDLNGRVMLNAASPELEGREFGAARDADGQLFIRAMIETARREGAGFVTYSWAKPGRPGESFTKQSYVRLLEPQGWVLGTGEYREDMVRAVQDKVLERVRQLRFGDDGYLFVLDYDSTMLAHRPKPELEGQRMLDAPLPVLRDLFPRLLEASAPGGDGFVEYRWDKPDGGASTKVTYVARMPEWRWLVGAGFHLDDLEAGIAAEQAQLRERLRSQLLALAAVAGLALVATLLTSRVVARRLRGNLEAFRQFFADAARLHTRIDASSVRFSEFDALARAANRMVEQRARVEREKQGLETQLQQRRKLEAIGRLAGGIAHDFNNILAAINGYAELGLAETDPEAKTHRRFERILRAGERARDLVRQILTFSRQDQQERRPVALGPLVEEALGLVRASTPSTVELRTRLDSAAWVEADPTQLHQVILNLCANAAAAMRGDGGVLTVGLADVEDGDGGKRVCLTVRDTGVGMPAELQERIFDPFFTTRGPGEGTGMGLAVVHGVVEGLGGEIAVHSAPGEGSEFRVTLPTVAPAALEDVHPAPSPAVPGGQGERVLLVDDEPLQTDLGRELLGRLGYRVTACNDPEAALARFAAAPERFDLVISDVTMPRLPGDRLARELKALRADLPVILCTGYSERLPEAGGPPAGVAAVLQKPLAAADLAAAVHGALRG